MVTQIHELINWIFYCKNWYDIVLVHFLGMKKFRKLRGVLTIRLKNGIIIQTDQDSDRFLIPELIFRNEYLQEPIKINRGDIVVDIGANIGIFTLQASNLGAKIFAYEPSSSNFRQLLRNTKDLPNITIERKAITRGRRKITLFIHPKAPGRNSLFPELGGFHKKEIVKTKTIKEIFEELPRKEINLLKLDCEGAEYEIIEQAKKEGILPHIHQIAMEAHTVAGNTPEVMKKKLLDAGYKVFVRNRNNQIENRLIYAWRDGKV